ncbi:unnamed protein product [Effrenium voratum]|nr:unnamed protein product [Effrenium voratum]
MDVPSARPVTFYTDEKALHRVEALLPTASLDLEAPSEHQLEAGLLERLAEPESQGDRHFRYLLEQPSEYGLPGALAPMVLKAFYQQLWRRSPKLRLRVLRGESDPQAFLDVSCRGCVGTPALKPSKGPALVSQLSAPAPRRAELARLFARASRSTSRKVGEKQLLQRIEELGFLALEKTGSRMAAGALEAKKKRPLGKFLAGLARFSRFLLL